MKIIEGDLIALAKQGHFDVITHGCNCWNQMGAGIAVAMKQNFSCDKFPMEHPNYRGDINKLGTIDYRIISLEIDKSIKIGNLNLLAPVFGTLAVVNSYTQYRYGRNHPDGVQKPVDYDAITLCMRKINHIFKGKSIGLPKIGCGLAGGEWSVVRQIIERELVDMDVTIINFN